MHRPAGVTRDQLPQGGREVGSVGRLAVLIVHYLEARALPGAPQDRRNEVRPAAAEQPLGAHDQMRLRQDIADGLLSGKLAPAIDGERRHRVLFPIRAARPPIEHVIGADMQQPGPGLARDARQVDGAYRVDQVRGVGLRLGAIDLGVAGTIDDPGWALGPHDALDGSAVFDPQVTVAQRSEHIAAAVR